MADYAYPLTGGTNSFQTTAEHLAALATLFYTDGIVGTVTNTSGVAPTTGALAVNASSGMVLAVTAGYALVTATPTGQASQRLIAKIAAQNITIASNATGSTRYDHIYVKIDPTNANTPNAAGDNVASIVQSRSTNSVTDNGTPPTYGYKIAVVTVANGAVAIANASIADSRVQTGATATTFINGTVPNTALAQNVAWTTFTPTLTGFSANPSNGVYTYQQVGKIVTVNISALGGTSNANSLTFTLPVTAATRTNNTINVWARAQDNGTIGTTPGLIEFSSGATVANVYKDHSGGVWTTSGTKGFRASFSYEAA